MPARSAVPFVVAQAVAVATPAFALACPDCATTRVVHQSVFDERFFPHLALISAPLLVLAVIVALLFRIDMEPRE